MLVPLLGDGHAHYLVRRTLLISAKSAVADGLLVRCEACEVTDLESPRHCGDRPYTRNRPQPPQPLLQQWITLQRTDQGVVQLLGAADHLPAQLQQRPYALMHILVGCYPFLEVANLVKLLL